MKRMFGMLLCVVLLCGFVPHTALAADDLLSLSSNEHGEIEVRLTAPVSRLIAAAYQGKKMVTREVKHDCAAGVYRFSLPTSPRYKVFAWDDSLSPLCEALEMTDDSAVVLREETDVPLPTLDDSVATALGAAVSEYAKASLTVQQIMELFADEEAFAAVKGDADLYLKYSKMLSGATDSLQNVMPSLTALDAVTQQQIDNIREDISRMPSMTVSLQSNEEVISWAEELTKQFDALKGNSRIQQLAKNMGCDAKSAYAALTTAQEVLYKRYTADADCYESWEKAMIAVKAGSKVAFFVCATAATAGATSIAAVPAVLTTGTVSAGGAAGILVGAADVGIELGVDSAKIIIGGNAKGDKIVQQLEDQLKPVTDGLLLYSLCTLNTANGAEKLAFLGDIGQRGAELYDSITLKSDQSGALRADRTSLDNSESAMSAEAAEEKGLPSGENALDDNAATTIDRIEDEYGKDREELAQLLKEEGIIKTDREFYQRINEFNEEVLEKVYDPDPDPTHPKPPERIRESYDPDTGELTGVICYDSKGNIVWRRSYEKGKVYSFSTNEWDENGDRIETCTRYFRDPVTNLCTTQIDWIQKTRYINGSYTNTKLLDSLDYNDNGTIGEHRYYDAAGNHHYEVYDGNGQISLNTIDYPDRVHELSYYTSNDPKIPFARIGHLQYEREYPKIPENEMFVYIYNFRREWTAVTITNSTDKLYEHGWNYTAWEGTNYLGSHFELVCTSEMP